jgi:hypothetical protein
MLVKFSGSPSISFSADRLISMVKALMSAGSELLRSVGMAPGGFFPSLLDRGEVDEVVTKILILY